MTTASLTITEEMYDALCERVFEMPDEERSTYMLCSMADISCDPWDKKAHKKYLGYKHIPVPTGEIISASQNHITWSTATFVKLLKQAKEGDLIPVIVHSHPGEALFFSEQDDRNEAELVKLTQNRNGTDAQLISIVLTQSGGIIGRVWLSPEHNIPFNMIRIIGHRFKIHYPERGKGVTPDAFARQALAFGAALSQDLQQLRIGIVGQGGTGNAVSIKLPRCGSKQLALFDKDIIESTNLNRIQPATQSDADAMRYKADVVANFIANMGLGARAIPIKQWVSDPECRDILKSCDVIFSCTDDHEGRMFLNRFAHFYLIPVIDVGLAIAVSDDETPTINDLSGRVTVVSPGYPCLLCRGIIDPIKARDEGLKRLNPAEYERQKLEAYVLGEGNPNPAVITFTDDIANMAVNELIHRLTGYRTAAGEASEWRRRYHHMIDRKCGAKKEPMCPICSEQSYWGRGDIEPFLDRIG